MCGCVREEEGKGPGLAYWRQRPREQRVSVPPLSSPKVDSPVIQSFFTPCVTAPPCVWCGCVCVCGVCVGGGRGSVA